MSKEKRIEKGCLAKDKVTGFTGIVYGITDFMTGCRRIGLQPQELTKDGDLRDPKWFDEPMCERIGDGLIEITKEAAQEDPGGPKNDCPISRGMER